MIDHIEQHIHIRYLAEVPELVPLVAKWSYDAWGQYDPTLTLEGQIKSLSSKLNIDKIPMTFVAFKDNIPVATVGLKARIPFSGYEDRKLWLSSFIVLEPYRNQGIGSYLLNHAYKEAKKLGYSKISLFTSNAMNAQWYAQKGWHQFATDTYQNHTVTLFEKNL